MQKNLENILSIQNLSFEKDKNQILYDINLSVKKGEMISIIGPNGAGKSTLLKLIIGTHKPTKGTITKKNNLKIGYVPQKINIDSILPLNVAEFSCASDNLLEYLDLQNLKDKFLYTLSGGELQRTILCRALTRNPDLLLLDESSQGLDISGILKFYSLIDKINKEMNTSIIMVSHDLNIVLNRTNEVLCLNRHICCKGTPNSISSTQGFLDLFGKDKLDIGLYQHDHNHTHNINGEKI